MFFTAKNHSALILKITSIWLELLTVFCFQHRGMLLIRNGRRDSRSPYFSQQLG